MSVPGVVDGWSELLAKHGTLDARESARAGDPLRARRLRRQRDHRHAVEGPGGNAREGSGGRRDVPRSTAARRATGDIFRNQKLAASLELIAKGGRDAFYRGAIAKAIADDMRARNGLLTDADLAAHTSDWTEPLSTAYRGFEVLEFPPNTQGVVALEMLNILEGFDLKALGHNTGAYLHLLVEAKKIAFADRDAWLADPAATPAGGAAANAVEGLRRDATQGNRPRTCRRVSTSRSPIDGASPAGEEHPQAHGDTIYLTAADKDGNVISLIQSIYESFGAGIVAGDTGITLHNRGALFSLACRSSQPPRARQAAVSHARARRWS